MSLVEVLTAATIGTMTLFAALSIFISGMMSWAKGTASIDAETQSRQAVRVISDQLREAMGVVIDSNGMGITFSLPKKNSSDEFIVPLEWDGVSRRIYHSNGNMILQVGSNTRVIARNVITTDPTMGSASYKIFTAPSGNVLLRQVNVKVVTRVTDSNQTARVGKKREQIFLRNVPQLEL